MAVTTNPPAIKADGIQKKRRSKMGRPGQMRFRDPKSGVVKYIADGKGNVYKTDKEGKPQVKISGSDSGRTEQVEVTKEDAKD
jgi:hypothetical protein